MGFASLYPAYCLAAAGVGDRGRLCGCSHTRRRPCQKVGARRIGSKHPVWQEKSQAWLILEDHHRWHVIDSKNRAPRRPPLPQTVLDHDPVVVERAIKMPVRSRHVPEHGFPETGLSDVAGNQRRQIRHRERALGAQQALDGSRS